MQLPLVNRTTNNAAKVHYRHARVLFECCPFLAIMNRKEDFWKEVLSIEYYPEYYGPLHLIMNKVLENGQLLWT